MEWWQIFKEWFLSLGEKYNVNPFIFGGIYLGAIPFFFISLYRTIKNIGSPDICVRTMDYRPLSNGKRRYKGFREITITHK